jgi:sodium-dependent dicarboxylate transporter 2/3/5
MIFKKFIQQIIDEKKKNTSRSIIMQFIGMIVFCVIWNLDLGLEVKAQRFLAIFSYVVCQWLFSSVQLYISGIVGVCLTVLTGVATPSEAFSAFSNPILFLFLGGFLLARGMESLGLDKKLSLFILSNHLIHGSFKRTYLAMLLITAVFSMWVSNTATMAMMLPISLGLIKSFGIKKKETKGVILLGIAYAATVGGLGTPIGSPPNIISLGMLKELANIDFTFLDWTKIGLPLVAIFLVVIFFYTILRIKEPISNLKDDFLEMEKRKTGELGPNEYRVMIIFFMTVCLWFLPSVVDLIYGKTHELTILLKQRLNTGVVAMVAGCLLFILPTFSKEKLLRKEDILRIDWGSLLLFASGLSLGSILFSTGLANLAGNAVVETFGALNFKILLIVTVVATVMATELTSNTAAANILIPIMIAAALKSGFSPLYSTLAVAISCNLAFMLPVATPPNAIVYGSGEVELSQMMRSGWILNVVGMIVISLGILFVA